MRAEVTARQNRPLEPVYPVVFFDASRVKIRDDGLVRDKAVDLVLIALPHRLGVEHRKPTAVPRKLDPVTQAAFIMGHEALLNQLSADEVTLFMDAAHPTHAVRLYCTATLPALP